VLTIEQIEGRRARARITKRELLAEANLHHETYRRIQRGANSPNMRTMEALAGALERIEQRLAAAAAETE